MQEITDLISRWNQGDVRALDQLISIAYSRLHASASRSLGFGSGATSLQATELVNELYLSFRKQKQVSFIDAEHFFSIVALKLRQILQTRYEKRTAQKRDIHKKVALDEVDSYSAEPSGVEKLVVNGYLDFVNLIDPVNARVAELKVFWEFDNSEIAEILAVSESTVARKWRAAKVSIAKRMSDESRAPSL